MKLKHDLSGPKSLTKARAEPDWPRLLKEDPVRYMALYKADYINTMERTNVAKTDFPAKGLHFSERSKIFALPVKDAERALFIRIQFRQSRPRYPGCPCAFFGEPHIGVTQYPCDCTVTDTDTLKKRYQFKRRLFSWRQLTDRPSRKEIATLGDWPSRLVLRILVAVARAGRNACWQ